MKGKANRLGKSNANKRTRRIVHMNVLPGEPLDGTGRVCIHLFVPDENGPFVESRTLRQVKNEEGIPLPEFEMVPVRGRLACDPKRLVAPVERDGVIHVTPRSTEPLAVTCPYCIASEAYKQIVASNKETKPNNTGGE